MASINDDDGDDDEEPDMIGMYTCLSSSLAFEGQY